MIRPTSASSFSYDPLPARFNPVPISVNLSVVHWRNPQLPQLQNQQQENARIKALMNQFQIANSLMNTGHQGLEHQLQKSKPRTQSITDRSEINLLETRRTKTNICDQWPSALPESLHQVLQILRCCQFRSPRQFCEVCDEHWRKSLEPLALRKVDRLWKRSALCRNLP